MDRARSSGIGAGCGVFGLLALLLGVAITVYLGARVSHSVSSGSGGGADRPFGQPGEVRTTLGVQPEGEVRGGQVVTVATRRFPPGADVGVSMCLAPDATVDVPRCDPSTTRRATVPPDGRLVLRYRLRARLAVGRLQVDCTDAAGRCLLQAVRDGTIDEALAPLTFA